jgi:hypothetical protein
MDSAMIHPVVSDHHDWTKLASLNQWERPHVSLCHQRLLDEHIHAAIGSSLNPLQVICRWTGDDPRFMYLAEKPVQVWTYTRVVDVDLVPEPAEKTSVSLSRAPVSDYADRSLFAFRHPSFVHVM